MFEEKVIISGAGGMGVLFTGHLLAHIAIKMNKYVSLLPSYGAEQRGGRVFCHVVISDEEIGSPVIQKADTLIVFNVQAFKYYIPSLKPSGMLVFNSSLIKEKICRNDIKILSIPANDIVESEIKDSKVFNVVMLGAYAKAKNICPLEVGVSVIDEVFKNNPSKAEVNKKAFSIGYNYNFSQQ
jgi:2-oxoglutarate ferredoxin oxidoreductase subunit gamma